MHSKEPWTTTPHPRQINGVTDFQLFDSNGHCIGTSWHGGTSDRIVACVNTMDGLNPEALHDALAALGLCESYMAELGDKLPDGMDKAAFRRQQMRMRKALDALEESK